MPAVKCAAQLSGTHDIVRIRHDETAAGSWDRDRVRQGDSKKVRQRLLDPPRGAIKAGQGCRRTVGANRQLAPDLSVIDVLRRETDNGLGFEEGPGTVRRYTINIPSYCSP